MTALSAIKCKSSFTAFLLSLSLACGLALVLLYRISITPCSAEGLESRLWCIACDERCGPRSAQIGVNMLGYAAQAVWAPSRADKTGDISEVHLQASFLFKTK